MSMNKVDAIWICRRMMKIWHPEFYGDLPANKNIGLTFLTTSKKVGILMRKITTPGRTLSNETRQTETQGTSEV